MPTFILRRVVDSIVTSCIAKRIIEIKDPTQQTFNISVQHLYFLRIKELKIAPTVPRRMRHIAAIDMSKSDAPKGFISKLALDAKVWKLPQMRKQQIQNFQMFLSFLISLNVYLKESSYFLTMLEGGIFGFYFKNPTLIIKITRVVRAQPKQSEKTCLCANSPQLSYFMVREGIAKPKPDPMIPEPTKMVVASDLYINDLLHFKEKTNKWQFWQEY